MVVTVLAMSPVESIGARLVGALLYAVGFIIVILGKFELFTEYTILAVLPLLSGRTTASRAAVGNRVRRQPRRRAWLRSTGRAGRPWLGITHQRRRAL